MEYASKPSFGALGTSIIVFWFATAVSAPKSASKPYQKLFSIHFTKVLTPRITSRPRKFTALAIYILILCLQLLEGKWVVQTNWRLIWKVHGISAELAARLWILGTWGLSAAILVFWMLFALLVGFFIVSLQILCIAELVFMVPIDDRDLEKKDKLGGGRTSGERDVAL
jgi:hypothetical protein